MEIIMIRHGESEDNVGKIFSTDTTRLTEKGKEQIKNTRERLKEFNYKTVYYSPLTRTVETLEYLELDGIEDARIREISFGIFGGKVFEEFEKEHPEKTKLWIEDPFTYQVPKGESINMVYDRLTEFLDEIVKRDESVVLVTHEGIIRLACSWVLDDPNHFFKFKAGNGSISVINVEDGNKYISKLNY